jgi:N utilization substance protein A
MAAQTAKQVIVQKLRETERETIFQEFKNKEGEIVVGTVQRKEGALVLVDLGRTTALLPPEEQIRGENYSPGNHVKVYIMSVNQTTKGPEIIVSRSHPEIVKKLFFRNSEIGQRHGRNQSVSPGRFSFQMAVYTDQENIDPMILYWSGGGKFKLSSRIKRQKVILNKIQRRSADYIANALIR